MKNIKQITQKIIGLVLSKTAKNTYYIFLGNFLSMIFSFFFTIVVVRILSVSDFGYFSALLSFLLLTSDIADIGIGSSLSAFLPRLEKTKNKLYSFLKTAFTSQISVAAFLLVVILILASFISGLLFHNNEFVYLVQITAFGIFGSIMTNFSLFTLLARQKFLLAAFYSGLGGAIRLIGLLVIFLFLKVNLENVVVFQTIGFLALAILGFKLTGSQFLKIRTDKGNLKKLLSFSIFLGLARGITAVAGRIDVLMLISLTNSVEAGIYSTASRVISIYPLLSGSFSTVLAPKLASITTYNDLKRFMRKVIVATASLIITDCIMIVIAKPFMTVLFGPDKGTPAYQVFQVLLVSMIFFIASIPSVSLAIYYLKKPHILTINSILQLLIVFLGNFFFIPRFNRLGAAYSLIAAYSITLFLTSFLSLYYLGRHHDEK